MNTLPARLKNQGQSRKGSSRRLSGKTFKICWAGSTTCQSQHAPTEWHARPLASKPDGQYLPKTPPSKTSLKSWTMTSKHGKSPQSTTPSSSTHVGFQCVCFPDDCGLGKTVVTLYYLWSVGLRDAGYRPSLILLPPNLIHICRPRIVVAVMIKHPAQ